MKKVLSILLSVLLLMACIPLGAIAVSAADSGVSGSCTWTLDDNGNLTISGYGKMANYTYTSTLPWGTDITSVTIAEGVTTIGDYAFRLCDNLTAVTIPNTATSIGEHAFAHCDALTSVTIGANVKTIGWGAFSSCIALESVTIPNGVTSIGANAFYWCNALTSVTIGSNVKTIGSEAFSYCRALTEVVIPNSVTTIDKSAFAYCVALTSATIGDGVTSIGGSAFYGCTALKDVTIGEKVNNIGYRAFYGCTALEAVTLGNSVATIGNDAFRDCSGLKSVIIPDSVTSIGYSAFYGCSALTDVYYTGSEEQRAGIAIDRYNDSVSNATWHYNYVPVSVLDLAAQSDIIYGDANGDGSINNMDVAILQRYVNNWEVTVDAAAADANGDGSVNNMDVAILQRYLNNWDVQLGPVQPDVPEVAPVILPATPHKFDSKDRVFAENVILEGNTVWVVFINTSTKWITEETNYAEFICYDAEGNKLETIRLVFGCLSTKSFKTMSFTLPEGTASVQCGNYKIVYWTDWE